MSFVNTSIVTGMSSGVLVVGTSTIVNLGPLANQTSVFFQYLSGATIFISGVSMFMGGGSLLSFLWDGPNNRSLTFDNYRGPLFVSAGTTALISYMIEIS